MKSLVCQPLITRFLSTHVLFVFVSSTSVFGLLYVYYIPVCILCETERREEGNRGKEKRKIKRGKKLHNDYLDTENSISLQVSLINKERLERR